MYIAELSFDGINSFRRETIDRPMQYIRVYTAKPMIGINYFEEGNITPSLVPYTIIVFQRKEQISHDTFRYVFSHNEERVNDMEYDSLNLDFQEPDENVNLDKLKIKMKGGEKAKRILLKYLRKNN
jgi:hypothetical protein